MKKFVVVVCLLALVIVPLWALARHEDVGDGNDTKGLLDVKRVDVDGKRPRFKIITFAGWSTQEMWDAGHFLVQLDSRGDGHFDHYALVQSTGSGMKASLFRDRKRKRDFRVSSLEAWRKNNRSVSVRVPLGKLNMPATRTYYRWLVRSLFTNHNCRATCIDRVPDRGAIRELLIEPEPTPSVSPSISVGPSSPPSTSPSSSASASPSTSPTP
ncbi:MAG TPA: hypothetical protein VFS18_03240 [Actinomycetota bacterium]|nr:hypothetical protein [Actinomycetota bacterium]